MGRAILGVFLGYVAMFIGVFVTFSILYQSLGVSGSFKEGSYETTITWNIVSLALVLLAGIGGGIVCALIVKGRRGPPKVLAGVIVALGLLMAVPVLISEKKDPTRVGDADGLEAMANAQQPLANALLSPFIGAAGTLIGAGLRKPKGNAGAADG